MPRHVAGHGRTRVSAAQARVLCIVLCAVVAGVAALDAVHGTWSRLGAGVAGFFPRAAGVLASDRPAWGKWPEVNRAARDVFDSMDAALEDESWMAAHVRPHGLDWLLRVMGAGSEDAYLGRDGWIFYRPDLEWLTTPLAEQRSDETAAIVAGFADELAARRIRLIVVPVPGKAALLPRQFARHAPAGPLFPRGFQTWMDAVAAAGSIPGASTAVLDVTAVMKGISPPFLKTDSHWTPEAMEAVAASVAERIESRDHSLLRREPAVVEGVGDSARMLRLPPGSRFLEVQEVHTGRVLDAEGKPWAPEHPSGILLLGDSFSGMYSNRELGWGSGAGFAEHLALASGQKVDRILRNDGGASATREVFVSEMRRDPERFSDLHTVVWQFAAREMAFGEWKPTPLPVGAGVAAGSVFLELAAGESMEVTGRVVAAGAIPRPGRTPYADFLTAFHLVDLDMPRSAEAIVYVFTLREHVRTRAAGWVPGSRVRLRMVPWDDREEEIGGVNRGELDDVDLLLRPAHFGEDPDSG